MTVLLFWNSRRTSPLGATTMVLVARSERRRDIVIASFSLLNDSEWYLKVLLSLVYDALTALCFLQTFTDQVWGGRHVKSQNIFQLSRLSSVQRQQQQQQLQLEYLEFFHFSGQMSEHHCRWFLNATLSFADYYCLHNLEAYCGLSHQSHDQTTSFHWEIII